MHIQTELNSPIAQIPVPWAVGRLIEYARDCFAALPAHTTIELLEHPKAITVPGAAYYAVGLLAWQGGWIPMIDIDAMLRPSTTRPLARVPRYALVVAYQEAPGMPVQHGAIALPQLPESVVVTDDSACSLPVESDMWPLVALAAFTIDGRTIPILDTSRLFGHFHG